ncbi:MAG: (d)CMP kinase, partial [Bdellovibrionales bacterium]|nr:(d)CMP kinase [Bdellovibrionales bacterium]
LIVEGRDAGTNVFPDSTNKFYLDASVDVRAERRFKELAGSEDVSIGDIARDIRERDDRDKNRAHSPHRMAEDAKLIDTSALSVDEVVELIEKNLSS